MRSERHRDQYITATIGAFLFGVGLGSYACKPSLDVLIGFSAAVLTGAFLLFSYMRRERFLFLALLLLFLVFGLSRGGTVCGQEFVRPSREQNELSVFFRERIGRIIPFPESELAYGILLGSSSQMPKEDVQNFRDAGLSHVTAVSGYNMSVIAGSVRSVTVFLGSFFSSLAVVCAVVLYSLVVGGGASVLRSALMAIVSTFGSFSYRPYSPLRALYVTAFCLCFLWPESLLYDRGFQFSFVASLGLIVVSPGILSFFPERGIGRSTGELVSPALSAYLSVLPLAIWYSGETNILSLPLNMVIAPLVTFAMFGSAVALFVSFLSIPLGQVFGLPIWVVLTLLRKGADFVASVPWSFIHPSGGGLASLVLLIIYLYVLMYLTRGCAGNMGVHRE